MRRGPKLTLKDIARKAEVSPSTVSLVLRDSPLVADETRLQVQRLIASLGYVRDRAVPICDLARHRLSVSCSANSPIRSIPNSSEGSMR